MDKSPFQFGKIAIGSSFINRTEDIKRLSVNIESGINTIMVSPRRWGKSSLVHRVSETYHKKHSYRFCFVDLFNIRTEDEFYQLFVKQIIKSTSNKWDEWVKNAKHFLSKMSPKISVGMDDITDIDIQFELKQDKLAVLDAIDLPEKIAKAKKIKLIICIDEFQNIENFDDPVGFQQKLRARWQKHQHAVYCLYGSKRHMLTQLFEKKSMPFYRFGDVIYLDKITKNHFIVFIVKSFKNGRKKIKEEFAEQLVDAVKCHPYYVQQLAHIVWNNCEKEVTKKNIEKSINDLINNNIILYEREFQNLSNAQINFLKVLRDGIQNNFTSNEVIQNYQLGSSSNVIRIMQALENKEIIDRFTGKIELVDPVFELWIKKRL